MLARVALIAAIAAMLAAAGCSPETRYRTLRFFFDGVPDPAEQGKPLPGETAPAAAGAAARKPVYKHGPYAARLCDACHRGEGGGLVMPVEELCQKCHDLNIKKKYIHGPVASGGCRECHNPHESGKPFLLTADPETFCFSCHNESEIARRQVHKDASGATCTECHDPHSSDNDFLLR